MEATVLHCSEASLSLSTLRTKLSLCKDEKIEYYSYENLNTAIQQLRRSSGYSEVSQLKNKGKKGRTFLLHGDRGRIDRSAKNPKLHSSEKRKIIGSARTDFKFRIIAKEFPSGKWKVMYKKACHNDEPSDRTINHPANRIRWLNLNERAEEIIEK